MSTASMTSNRPYLLRAMYDWISDNGLTPYILVDAGVAGVQVPKSAIKDGRVVLNIAARAVSHLELGKERVGAFARLERAVPQVSGEQNQQRQHQHVRHGGSVRISAPDGKRGRRGAIARGFAPNSPAVRYFRAPAGWDSLQ